MNERTPKHGDHETALLKDLTAKIVVELSGSDIPEEARLKALGVVLETSRNFIFERARPVLRVVK